MFRLYMREQAINKEADQTTSIPKLKRLIVKDQDLQNRIDALTRMQFRCDER
jgi:hypothetical protein